MKKFIVTGVLCALVVLGGTQSALASTASTTTTTGNAAMLAKIQDLMKLIAELQTKLAAARGEIKDLVKDLSVGAEGDDVKEIQEILASDPSIFKVKPTGYYGPLTEEAIKKFQERYGLTVTGIVDEATREVMRELKMEKKNGMIPPGLVKSDEVKDRIKTRLQEKWGDCVWGPKFRASDCKKGHGDDSDDDEAEDDDSDDDNASSTDATRADALAAIVDAQEAVNTLKEDIKDLVDADATEEEIKDAKDALRAAQKKLLDARRKLSRGQYDEAVDKAEDAMEEAADASDDSDDSADDSDDDSDDDDSDDSDDDDDDDEDDDSDDDSEDDD